MAEPGASVLPLRVEQLHVEHDGRALLQLPQWQLERGQFCCIVGPNGAGKSLLLKAMAGLHPGAAAPRWGGRAPSRAGRRRLGMLLQTPVLLRRSVAANIDFALRAQTTLDRRARRAAIERALALAGMSHLHEASARLLSGGERQRLALVRALACEPQVLLLDEPAASMDPASTAWLERTLLQAHRDGLTLAMVTHDLNQARRLATRVLLLHRGHPVEDADKETFFASPRSDEARAFVAGELIF